MLTVLDIDHQCLHTGHCPLCAPIKTELGKILKKDQRDALVFPAVESECPRPSLIGTQVVVSLVQQLVSPH